MTATVLPFVNKVLPRHYQTAQLEAVRDAEARGLQRIIVASATGTGKTSTFSWMLQERGGRAVVLVHRDELVRQAAERIERLTGIKPGIVKADEDEVNAQIVVASVQTLVREERLRRLMSPNRGDLFRPGGGLKTVVVDECHHYLGGEEGNSFGGVLHGLGSMTEGGPLTVGFTATPERADGEPLGATWQEIVHNYGIIDGIRDGVLCNIKAKQVQLACDFNKLHVRMGEFRDEESAEMLMEANAPKHAAEAYLKLAAGRKALVFTPTVAVAEAMAFAFREAGVSAEVAHGNLPMAERRAILKRLRTGETLVVPNAQLLTEGFDEPSINCIIMARPTRSRPFAIQMIGRGTRIFPGKEDLLVIDLVGKLARMDLVTVASLFNVKPEAAEKGVIEAIEEQVEEQRRLKDEAPAREGRLVDTDISLFAKRSFAWVQSAAKFVLSLGGSASLVLEPCLDSDDLWNVVRHERGKFTPFTSGRGGTRSPDKREKLFAGLPLEMAQGAAEDVVRQSGLEVLNAKDARWRKGRPSERQEAMLRKQGLWKDGMNKGEASDAISAFMAGKIK